MLPTTQLATTIDTFIKDTVLSANEGRILIGRKPSAAANANALSNPFTSSGNEQPQTAAQMPMEGQTEFEEDEFPDIDTNDI